MSELSAIIRAEMLPSGSISFGRFMELALYHPEHGYYRRERERPRAGREGDFFTSVSVGPLFGRLLARQFLQMWRKLGRPNPFWIIEQGAEDAQLACDVLGWCQNEAPEFFAAIRYALIETASTLKRRQSEKIQTEGLMEKVDWFDAPDAMAKLEPAGVFFSNELADAFPVRIVTYRESLWRELRVTCGGDNRFAWMEKSIGNGELTVAIARVALPELEGYTTEIQMPARDWMEKVGRTLKRGYVLTIDYGFPASLYYAPFRRSGTLTGYRDHQRVKDVLADPGDCDITAHVDFTGLARAGEEGGLATLGFLDQQHFLMGVAHDELSGNPGPRTGISDQLRAWQTLTHPGYLGVRFQVLLQAKDAPGNLDGLRYARPGGLD